MENYSQLSMDFEKNEIVEEPAEKEVPAEKEMFEKRILRHISSMVYGAKPPLLECKCIDGHSVILKSFEYHYVTYCNVCGRILSVESKNIKRRRRKRK